MRARREAIMKIRKEGNKLSKSNLVPVIYYTKENCPLCSEGLEILNKIRDEMDLRIEVVDIYQDDALLEEYQLKIPVVAVNGEELDFGKLSETKLRRKLGEWKRT
jgi:hypothetical protein